MIVKRQKIRFNNNKNWLFKTEEEALIDLEQTNASIAAWRLTSHPLFKEIMTDSPIARPTDMGTQREVTLSKINIS